MAVKNLEIQIESGFALHFSPLDLGFSGNGRPGSCYSATIPGNSEAKLINPAMAYVLHMGDGKEQSGQVFGVLKRKKGVLEILLKNKKNRDG